MRIDTDLLIPGRGAPVRQATVVLDGKVIRYAGPRAGAPAGATADLTVPVLMPGLWDCHVHFAGQLGGVTTEALLLTPPAVAAARSVKDAERALLAGVTSVRDLGGCGVHLATVIDEGTVPGPSVYGAGRVISQTAGHSDAHRLPREWVVDGCQHTGMLQIADGVPDCLLAVRTQLREGAKVIKVCVSGGVVSEIDHPMHQQFSPEELRAIVEEAARAHRAVAAHAHGGAGIEAAVAAGCRTIEHGTVLEERTAEAMREAGMLLVPTRTVIEGLLGHPELLPPSWRDRFAELGRRHLESIRIAHQAGVRIAMGTDLGLSRPGTELSWGTHAQELVHLVYAGLTPAEAIEAATANGPATLGDQAPRSGLLAEGYDADVLAVSADPLVDVSVLTDPANITHVWKFGRLVKSPGGA